MNWNWRSVVSAFAITILSIAVVGVARGYVDNPLSAHGAECIHQAAGRIGFRHSVDEFARFLDGLCPA